jgi:hypothetical protein
MATTEFVSVLLFVAQDLEERHAYQYAGAIRVAARRISELEATATLPDACERCGARLDQKPRGRPRRFCSERCRRKSAGNGSVDHNALEQAIWARKEGDLDDLIHHSDRGSQYLSIRYTEKVAEAGGVQRVGGRGDSYDNALAESVIALFKTELIYNKGPWSGLDPVEFATLEWVDSWNNTRSRTDRNDSSGRSRSAVLTVRENRSRSRDPRNRDSMKPGAVQSV